MNSGDRIGFGCVQLSSFRSASQALKSLKSAFDQGIRWFDTAPLYGQGYSELLLGKFLKSLPASERRAVLVTSKFGLGPSTRPKLPPEIALPLNHIRKTIQLNQTTQTKTSKAENLHFEHPKPAPKAHRRIDVNYLKQQFRGTCERIGLDHFHGYLGHELLPAFLTEEAMAFLQSLKHSGRIQEIGIGVAAHHILHAKTDAFAGIDLLQYNGNDPATSLQLMERFPNHRHIHHSILKAAPHLSANPEERLRQHAQNFPEARIIFSSSKTAHIQTNARAITESHAPD